MDETLINVAVVTGGHAFNVPEFQLLFERMTGIKAYIQHLDDFASAAESQRDAYDVVLLYIMMMDDPTDDLPGFRGKPKRALERLTHTPQGLIIMHHGLLAYPNWPFWDELVGIDQRDLKSYEHDVSLNLKVENPNHPVMQDLSDWQMVDETYELTDPTAKVETLLSVKAEKSMHTVAWAHQVRQSRVFCLQLGHDEEAFQNAQFQQLLTQAIAWTCHKS